MQQVSTLDEVRPEQKFPWWFKYLQKILCVFAGLVCGILGILVLVSLSATCLVAGVFQIAIGFVVIVMEAPMCCACIDFVDKIGKFSENRKPWQKAALYCLSPILPIGLCPGISTISGCILVIIAGLTYAYQALGRKASREEMRQRATDGSGSGLVGNAEPFDESPALVHASNEIV